MVTPLVHDGAMNLVISCDECVMQNTSHCQDCVVSRLSEERGDAVIIDAAEERAVRMLARAGLVPALQHHRQSTCA